MTGARTVSTWRVALAVAALSTAAVTVAAAAHAADLRVRLGDRPVAVSIQSLLEIRDRNLVRQGWDISCGAAALSTILTYTYAAPYSEAAIAASILANTDPEQVRARGGFSLLDLKRFAEAVGFTAQGYGGLAIADLARASGPVILPVRIRGLDHFVVFHGHLAGRVVIGDPAFGNLSIPERRFLELWRSRIGLVISSEADTTFDRAEQIPEPVLALGIPALDYVFRITRGAGALPAGRR